LLVRYSLNTFYLSSSFFKSVILLASDYASSKADSPNLSMYSNND